MPESPSLASDIVPPISLDSSLATLPGSKGEDSPPFVNGSDSGAVTPRSVRGSGCMMLC